ncbi:hypothetical protein LOK49_LG03G00474 [Camellia lanceoleosa]|uniref:Uncharacterized protein n=1 Tax=Camellia lanceoleosa TaxID=1840588 RepID=A0ACC0IA52_9ERIC|nr:hypothetical protein LOK49_LG03G00474 [Camellia lanceoleosa]
MRGMDAKIPYRESRSPRHIRVSATQQRTQTFLPLPIASLFCCFFSGTVVHSPILIPVYLPESFKQGRCLFEVVLSLP